MAADNKGSEKKGYRPKGSAININSLEATAYFAISTLNL